MPTPGEQRPEHDAEGAGRVLAGRYRVTGRLGRGGMGVVWRAADEVLGRQVAVKELRTWTDAGRSELEDLRTRMQREARAAARVRHPGVIAVHDVAQHEGRPVIVMELVEGRSLEDVLRERGPLAPREAAAVGARVMDALAAAHRAGVLHRDVKPGNVLLEDGTERVVLTDFGIAAVEEPDDGAATQLTGSGELIGSLDYMAPERARGEPLGPACDVWALGATLFAAVEGGAPFRRTSTWSTLTAIVVDPLPEPRRAGELAPVLVRLMEKDPGSRPDAPRAAELLEAVAAGAAPPADSGTVRLTKGGTPRADAASGQPPHRPAEHGAARPAREDTPQGSFFPGTPAPGQQQGGEAGPVPRAGAGGPGRHPGAQGGFGGPYAPEPHRPDGAPDTDRGTVPTRESAAVGRRRAVVAAAVGAVVLAGASVTWALMTGDAGEDGVRAEKGAARTGSADPREQGGEKDEGRRSQGSDPSPDGRGEEGGKPGAAAGGSSGERDGGDGGGSGTEPGGTDGSTGAEGGGSTGGGQSPLPTCHPRGGGKFDCSVWKTATSYDAAHEPAGKLNAGTNYFYCQRKLPHRETSGRWTNVWWARTDDDSGNTNVDVSVVYIRGGDNDRPVPGLPVC